MYDVVTSLGYNCEISFRLENYFGSINAMPFSWSYVMEREYFPSVLENIAPLFAGEVKLMDDQMIRCENFKIKFHPRYDILRREGEPTEETLQEAIEELRGRVSHLKQKYLELVAGDKNTLFLMKVENHGDEDNISYIKNVYETMKRVYLSGKFTIVAIVEEEALTEGVRALEEEQLKIRSLKRFAPRKHTDTMGDVKGWKRILDEFCTADASGYYKRLWEKRRKWFFAVVKKKLHIGG